MANIDDEIYYRSRKIASHNADVNIVGGGRSKGKSTDWLWRFLRDFHDGKGTFAWARKTEEMIKKVKPTFLNVVKAIYEKDNPWLKNFRVVGDYVIYCDDKNQKMEIAGCFVSLSLPGNMRGLNMVNLRWFMVDEFQTKDNQYVDNSPKKELENLKDIFFTCARLNQTKLVLVSNAYSSNNPYFRTFKVQLRKDPGVDQLFSYYIELKNGEKMKVAVELGASNDLFTEKVNKSTAGKLSVLLDGGESDIDNKFILDDLSQVVGVKARKNGSFTFNLYFDGEVRGVYANRNQNIMIIGKALDGGRELVYGDIVEASRNNNNRLVSKKDTMILYLFDYYQNGLIGFEDQATGEWFIEFLNNCF